MRDARDHHDHDAVRARCEAAGQGHVLRFADELPHDERAALFAQLAALDLELVARLAAAPEHTAAARRIEPPGAELVRHDARDPRRRAAAARGRELLRAGRVAVVIAAGGQGTRLGSDAPKGLFPVGPRSRRPLFAWLTAKLRHHARAAGRPVPLVLMVSAATEEATRACLVRHDWFGLPREHVHVACQGSLPALDDAGRLLLEARGRIALAPNGHGGLYRALVDSGVLDALERDGVRTLSYVQVDNPLVHVVDPLFLGLHAEADAAMSSKGVAKRAPEEKVGVFARVDGRPAIVEYTELTAEQAHATDAAGRLLFGHGNIAAHAIETAFAREMAERGLPLHRARKKVPHVDAEGRAVDPRTPNATKFEAFLFDALPLAPRTLVLETLRAEEFSPIKNATGDDSPASAARDLDALFRGWHERAALAVPEGPLEVDPFDAPDERAFRALHGLAEESL